jgi:hypothetical protein
MLDVVASPLISAGSRAHSDLTNEGYESAVVSRLHTQVNKE